MKPTYLLPPDVARTLRVSVQSVTAMCRSGALPAIRVKKQWRISAAGFDRWQREQLGIGEES